MILKLIRQECKDTGIFSDLCAENGVKLYSTLEHAYPVTGRTPDKAWAPKIPNGIYTCVRGTHELHIGQPFETFEVTGVAGHKGLLFHKGNVEDDSKGCILVGHTRVGDMVTNSRDAFADFMEGLKGLDSFTLVVSS